MARDTTVFMASNPSGSPAPCADCTQRPARKEARLCTGAKLQAVTDMTVIIDFAVGLDVSVAEADLYLHWASDLLAPAKDDDDGGC